MKDEKPIVEKPQSDNEEEEYFLSEPKDFDEYLQLINDKSVNDKQSAEFDLRMIAEFIASVEKGELPRKWIMNAIANAFAKVIRGGRWEDEFPLPWTEMNSPWSRAEESALHIYCYIINTMSTDSKLKLINVTKDAADKYFVSYEKARAAYYKWKSHFSKKYSKT